MEEYFPTTVETEKSSGRLLHLHFDLIHIWYTIEHHNARELYDIFQKAITKKFYALHQCWAKYIPTR